MTIQQLLGFSVAVQLASIFVPATNAMWAYLLLSTWFRHIVGNHWFIYGTVFIFVSAVSFGRPSSAENRSYIFLGVSGLYGSRMLCLPQDCFVPY